MYVFPASSFRPAVPIVIEDCGVIELEQQYEVNKRDAPADVRIS